MEQTTDIQPPPRRRQRSVPLAVRRAVIERDGMVCQLCRCIVQTHTPRRPDSLHLDHIVPFGFGGEQTVGNLRVTCSHCNLGRTRPPNRQSAAEDIRAARRRRLFADFVSGDLPAEQSSAMQQRLDELTAWTRTLTARQRRAWCR